MNSPKHVEFNDKFVKLVHLVGFIIKKNNSGSITGNIETWLNLHLRSSPPIVQAIKSRGLNQVTACSTNGRN